MTGLRKVCSPFLVDKQCFNPPIDFYTTQKEQDALHVGCQIYKLTRA
jgi:hypothetical protein